MDEILIIEEKLMLPNSTRCELRTFSCSRRTQLLNKMNKLEAELQKNLIDSAYALKIVHWHGLTVDEPLVFEKIIESCFDNPNRKKFPDFFKERGWIGSYSFYEQNESPE